VDNGKALKARFSVAFVLEASAADVGGQWSWCWSNATALANYAIMIMMIICLK